MLQDRQTADSLAGPENKGARVNLLNWDGKGSPPGLFPPKGAGLVSRPTARGRRLPPGAADDRRGSRSRCCSTTPTRTLLARVDLLRSASHGLPTRDRRTRSATFLDHLESTPLPELQADYVETFDTRRRCNLFLTYFAHGDTRKRGMALLRFKQTYLRGRASSSTTPSCPTTCAWCSSSPPPSTRTWAAACCSTTGPGSSCCGSRCATWARRGPACVDAVTATLPPLRGDERDAVRRLAAEGPPEEEVGLAPFASPQFSPGAATAPRPRRPCCPCRRSREPAR